mmetsp:Transcript_11921/g.19403  ORF Transcript_11921/g.19403 Transcript_11921/m.19403 type:complete len:179 (-) Transcript_11921:117-653(-)
MDYFVATAKLGILQYCHAVRNEDNKENVISCIVGEELEWSENQAIVSFVAEVCKSVEEKSALIEKCESQTSNINHYRELVDELNRKIRESKQDSILHSYELESELRDLKESNLVMSTACEKSKTELAQAKAKLIEVEMYMDSDEGGFTLKLEEELAVAKLRLAELESEKDEWEMRGNS